jgi:hypothetical protein
MNKTRWPAALFISRDPLFPRVPDIVPLLSLVFFTSRYNAVNTHPPPFFRF